MLSELSDQRTQTTNSVLVQNDSLVQSFRSPNSDLRLVTVCEIPLLVVEHLFCLYVCRERFPFPERTPVPST